MSSVSGSCSAGSPSKRARDDSEAPEGVDESLQAKIARKEARVIRNRESAQRSRNQRKMHLAEMEVRVRQLEEENKRLRSERSVSVPPVTATSEVRHSTPEQNVLNLADQLGIPPAMVSSGVSLSSVAPPPSGIDVKQEPVSASAPASELDRLVNENKALSERVAILENVLKQVVAVSNFSGFTSSQPIESVSLPVPAATTDSFDFAPFLQTNTDTEPTTSTTYPSSTMSTSPLWSDNETTLIHPVACHSAAGEGDRINVASEFDYQGAIGQSGENSLGLGQTQGMDFECLFEHDQTYQGHASEDFSEAQNYGVQLDSWDEGISTLLAKLESDIESSSTGQQGMVQMGGAEEWFNVETMNWERVAV